MGTVTQVVQQARPLGRGDDDPEPEPARGVMPVPEPDPEQEHLREENEQLARTAETRRIDPPSETEQNEKDAAKEITGRQAEMTDAKTRRLAAFDQMIEQQQERGMEYEQDSGRSM